jgi:hypothetical protein
MSWKTRRLKKLADQKLCDYGCDKPALYTFKNGKVCCSEKCESCEVKRIKNGLIHKGKKHKKHLRSKLFENLNLELCSYGCGQLALFKFNNGKVCCVNDFNHCKGYRKKLSSLRKGKVSPHKGKKRDYSLEARKKMGDVKRGKKAWNSGLKNCFNEDTLKKMSISHTGVSYLTESGRNIIKQNMLNGGAVKAIKGIINPSKPELMLREIVKELYPNSDPQHSIFNYSVDIALVEQKIAIEYDGWYHFDTEDHKEYHKFRQEKIEKEGWKFLRYTMFDKFPDKEQVQEDINKIISGVN